MGELFDSLMLGINEAVSAEQGRIKAKRVCYSIDAVQHLDAAQIKEIRLSFGMTQSTFAQFMGVSNKTVEAWERGTNRPTGPACRLLSLIKLSGLQALPFISIA